MKEETEETKAESNGKPSKVNPWLKIWTHPAASLEFAIRYRPESYLHRLYMLLGVVFVFAVRLPDWLTMAPHPIGVMIQVLLVGPVGGIIGGYIISALVRNAAGWFGHSTDPNAVKLTVAWTHLPVVLAYAVFLAVFIVMDRTGPQALRPETWLFDGLRGWIPVLAGAPFMLYALLVRARGISYVVDTSFAKAALIWLISILLAYAPVIFFSIVYGAIFTGTIDFATQPPP